MTDFEPTNEQVAIRDGFRTGQNLVINAGAGTGKTATLRLLADEAKPKGQRGIYLAFNKPIAEEAQRKFAGTPVVSKTIHSLAYAQFGAPRAHRMNGPRWGMRYTEKAKLLGIGGRIPLHGLTDGTGSIGGISTQQLVKMVESAVTGFCHSADEDFLESHITFDPAFRLTADGQRQVGEYVIARARRYWDDIAALDGKLKFSHDHYLKLYALSKPDLPYDFILLDEAQDTDPLMIGLIQDQKNAQVVAVGDRAQSIYGWRGAVSAMNEFGGQAYDLSQSFRFGEEIAEYANRFLALLGDFRLTGAPGKPSSVWRSQRPPEAILARTNVGSLVELTHAQQNGRTTAIGGRHVPAELRRLAVAAKELHDDGKTKHADLSMFGSWKQVQDYAAHEADEEMVKLVTLIDEQGADKVIRAIDACVEPAYAQTIVSTAHAAKGLEWKHVKVAADYRAPRGDTVSTEEVMLSYVAVTRAQRHLDPLGVEWVEKFQGTAVSAQDVQRSFVQQQAVAKKAFAKIDIAGITAGIKQNRNRA